MSAVRWCLVGSAVVFVVLLETAAPLVRAQGATLQPQMQTVGQGDVARGAYIVEELAQCGRCHSPVASSGERDRSRWLMGGPLDFAPTVARDTWAMTAPRIFGMPPGTDEQFIHLMITGISRTGRPPMRPMPQFHMTQSDAESVLAYLKSLASRERATR